MAGSGGAPPDVRAWPGVEVTGPLAGGARAAVFAAHRGAQRLVVKVSTRSPESLAWELDLLRALHRSGLPVPTAVPTGAGDDSSQGVWVQPFLPGGPPRSARDWQQVAEVVAAVHDTTRGWPQRPGAAGANDLLTATAGADVDLSAMPAEAVALVRAHWRALLDQVAAGAGGTGSTAAGCVVHGDLGPGAVLADGGRVSVNDWDEARVDVAAFDLAGLPRRARRRGGASAGLDDEVLEAAALAWETATCWTVEPQYARRCLRALERLPTAG